MPALLTFLKRKKKKNQRYQFRQWLFEANLIGLLCNEFLPVPWTPTTPLPQTQYKYSTPKQDFCICSQVSISLLDLLFLKVFHWHLLTQAYVFWSSCLTDSRLVAALTCGLTFHPLHAFPPSLWSFHFCLQENRSFFLDGQYTGEFDVPFWVLPLYFSMLLLNGLDIRTYSLGCQI